MIIPLSGRITAYPFTYLVASKFGQQLWAKLLGAQLFVETCFQLLWVKTQKAGLLARMIRVTFSFVRNCQTFTKWLRRFAFPLGIIESSCLYILTSVSVSVLDLGPSHSCDISLLFCFVFLGRAEWLVGSYFPNQGLNPGNGSESAAS